MGFNDLRLMEFYLASMKKNIDACEGSEFLK